MAQIAPLRPKINTEVTQPSPARASRRRSKKRAGVAGEARSSVRDPGRAVIELDHGVTVYPPQADGEPWRAVFTENGQRRYRQAATEAKLAARLAKVTERLQADAPDMERPGADLIDWYLSPGRHRVGQPWSRKHADTQRRLCERFVAPVISGISCQDIKAADMQRVVNAAPTQGEGERLRRCLSAMITAGITGGYLANPRLDGDPAPEFTIFGPGGAAQAGEENVFGIEVLRSYGSYAIRPAADDPWLSGPGAWEDEGDAARRIVRTVRTR